MLALKCIKFNCNFSYSKYNFIINSFSVEAKNYPLIRFEKRENKNVIFKTIIPDALKNFSSFFQLYC